VPRIIAGRFQSRERADEVAVSLVKYVDRADIFIYHDNPPGQFQCDPLIPGGDKDNQPCAVGSRPGGVILSVRISDVAKEGAVIATLRLEGAGNIEQPEGEWLDGDWVGFDPVAAPRWVKKRFIASGSGGGAGKQ